MVDKDENSFTLGLVFADDSSKNCFSIPPRFCPLINYRRRDGKRGKSNRVKAHPSNVPESLALSERVNAV